jgi:hypothetical protein
MSDERQTSEHKETDPSNSDNYPKMQRHGYSVVVKFKL